MLHDAKCLNKGERFGEAEALTLLPIPRLSPGLLAAALQQSQELASEILSPSSCTVDTWQCLVHSLIQGVTTIYHQATSLAIIPTNTFSGRIVLGI